MAWLELHQSLPQHRKTLRLKTLLKIKTPQAVGHLCMLWLWALDNAQDGDISPFTDEEIAEISGWSGKDARKFMQALISAGFVDENSSIHDWLSYAGRLIDYRKNDAERKRKSRSKSPEVTTQSEECPIGDAEKIAAMSAGCPVDVTQDGARNRNRTVTVPRTLYDDDVARVREEKNSPLSENEAFLENQQLTEELAGLSPSIREGLFTLCEKLFTTYFKRTATAYDQSFLYQTLKTRRYLATGAHEEFKIDNDDIELITQGFEAAASAGVCNWN